MSLQPSLPNVIKANIPEYIRLNDPNVAAFLEYYYEWLSQTGSLDFLQNILEYRDIDTTNDAFIEMNIKNILSVMPASIKADKRLVAKNLAAFFKAKGTESSFNFLMAALFGDGATIGWYSDKIFKASANTWTSQGKISIVGDIFDMAEGAILEQDNPSASVVIERVDTTSFNGKNVNLITVQDKNYEGSFVVGNQVKQLHNTVDRTWLEVTKYYTFQSVSINSITVIVQGDELPTTYVGQIIKQLSSPAQATVSSYSREAYSGLIYITLNFTNLTGTWGNGDVYLLESTWLDKYYTKLDWNSGVVSPSITALKIDNPGSGYVVGQPLSFIGGSGTGTIAKISDLTTGQVDRVMIMNEGSGYVVGDKITAVNYYDNLNNAIINQDSLGRGFDAEVTHIDGVGAAAHAVMELESIVIRNPGTSFTVGDVLQVNGGTRDTSVLPARITVASVSGVWTLNGIDVTAGGYGYTYCRLTLYQGSTKLTTFVATPILDSGVIVGATVVTTPSISAAVTCYVNGHGASATATLTGTAVTSLTISGGHDYIDPIITAIGAGSGFEARLTMTAGVITGYSIISGGNYTSTPTMTISERYGTGAVLTPNLTTDGTNGALLTFTMTQRGRYTTVPDSFDVGLTNVTGTGTGLVVSLKWRINSVVVDNQGIGYRPSSLPVVASTGIGTGFVAVPTIVSGVITAVSVLNPGQDYSDDTVLTLTGSPGSGATFSVVTANGQISKVNVLGGGSLYSASGTYTWATTPTAATLTPTVSNNGAFVGVTIIEGGTGYKAVSELTPIKIAVSSSTGSGAVLIPVLDGGTIIKVNILHAGSKYVSSDTITVTGGGGSLANISPIVFAGRIVGTTINNRGSGYQYGTSILIVGDGSNAVLTPIVNTGITSVVILDGGSGYTSATTLTVTGVGSSASVTPVVVNGVIVDIIVNNAGTGYFEASTSITASIGSGAVFKVRCQRAIGGVTVTTAGSNYTYADLLVLGDGTDAILESKLDGKGAVLSIANTTGTGYTTTPSISITDTSGYGAISQIKINNSGWGYRELPLMKVSSIAGTGADLISLSSSIGGVKKVEFTALGTEYYETPIPVFPLTVIIKENTFFLPSETVTLERYPYKDDYFLLNDTDHLLLEDTSLLILTDTNAYPIAKLTSYDHDRHLMTLECHDNIMLLLETEPTSIQTEQGIEILHEYSNGIFPGDVIVGSTTQARGTVVEVLVATATAEQGSLSYINYHWENNLGLLNNNLSRIHDNDRYQDHAYAVTSAHALAEYEKFFKDTVHIAGYKMFGDVAIDLFANLPSAAVGTQGAQHIVLYLNLMMQVLMLLSVFETRGIIWLDNNKFRLGSTRKNYLLAGDATFILTETGTDNLVLNQNDGTNTSFLTSYGGPFIYDFSSLGFTDIYTYDSFGNVTGYNLSTPPFTFTRGAEIGIWNL